ncbi:unnamed protein product [Protopolystoma xenopodis]|uniref:EF-hand domain-containing protein n=1 Tax=Protopolystoma xenopodis TaxID=117903 RepID=A0A448X0X1_9PLAT|nr:unnamed protein product [Protopolystoma xenopodis]
MGSGPSKCLDEAEVDEISRETGCTFCFDLCKLIIQRNKFHIMFFNFFRRHDFLLIPELAINPLGDRIVNEFFKDSQEELNFRQYVRKLACFRKVRATNSTEYNNREAKLRFLFGMYDLDMDEKISTSELLGMLQMMVGANITVEQVSFDDNSRLISLMFTPKSDLNQLQFMSHQ